MAAVSGSTEIEVEVCSNRTAMAWHGDTEVPLEPQDEVVTRSRAVVGVNGEAGVDQFDQSAADSGLGQDNPAAVTACDPVEQCVPGRLIIAGSFIWKLPGEKEENITPIA
ncbi:MAG: hypothetical protein R3C19_00565 [Planctomycetaceae bacterium]